MKSRTVPVSQLPDQLSADLAFRSKGLGNIACSRKCFYLASYEHSASKDDTQGTIKKLMTYMRCANAKMWSIWDGNPIFLSILLVVRIKESDKDDTNNVKHNNGS